MPQENESQRGAQPDADNSDDINSATDSAGAVGAVTGGGTTTSGSDFGVDVTGALKKGTGDLGEATGASDVSAVHLDSGADIRDGSGSSRNAPGDNIQGGSVQ